MEKARALVNPADIRDRGVHGAAVEERPERPERPIKTALSIIFEDDTTTRIHGDDFHDKTAIRRFCLQRK